MSRVDATGVVLDDGTQLAAHQLLSSAGYVETMRMCDDVTRVSADDAGQMSFTESVAVLDCSPARFGLDQTIVFFNDSPRFHWQAAKDLIDCRTGVVCSPNNYLYDDAEDGSTKLPDGVVRVTSIASFPRWTQLADDDYQMAKLRCYDQVSCSAVRFVPDYRGHVIDTDFFTPKTIRRFTWHANGAVYGAPQKRLDGTTDVANLFICGTDQGFVGIVGTIMSGISVANQHLLR